MQWECGSSPPELFTPKGSLKPNLKVPRFVLIFYKMPPISRLLLKHGIFTKIKLLCLERVVFSVSKGVAGNITGELTGTAGSEQKCVEPEETHSNISAHGY